MPATSTGAAGATAGGGFRLGDDPASPERVEFTHVVEGWPARRSSPAGRSTGGAVSEIPAGRLVLRPIGRVRRGAVLEGRSPEGLTLANGYPSQFSLEVMEMVARGRPGAGDGPWFMVRRDDGTVVGEIGATVDGSTAQVGYTVVEPSWGQGSPRGPAGAAGPLLADPGIDRVGPRPLRATRPAAGSWRRPACTCTAGVGEVDGEQAELVLYELPTGPSGPARADRPSSEPRPGSWGPRTEGSPQPGGGRRAVHSPTPPGPAPYPAAPTSAGAAPRRA